jgi:hypothetical protein
MIEIIFLNTVFTEQKWLEKKAATSIHHFESVHVLYQSSRFVKKKIIMSLYFSKFVNFLKFTENL